MFVPNFIIHQNHAPPYHRINRDGIIVALDLRSGQLKSTSLGRYQLPYFVPVAGVEEAAGVQDLFYTGLFYTGYPTRS